MERLIRKYLDVLISKENSMLKLIYEQKHSDLLAFKEVGGGGEARCVITLADF